MLVNDALIYRAEQQQRAAVKSIASILRNLCEEVVSTNERLRFLLDASEALSSSIDYEATLQNVARVATPELADICVLEVVDGASKRQLSYPDDSVAIHALLGDTPAESPTSALGEDEGRVSSHCLKSCFSPEIDERWMLEEARSVEHLTLLRALDPRSVIKVALIRGEETLGSLTLCFTGGSRRHTEVDLHLAEELGARAATAIYNARLYRAAEEKRRLSEQANQAKDEFLGVVSHDLRAPLNAILGWSQLLRRDRMKDPATFDKALAVIERNAMAQVKLVEDILDVSRIISGKLRLDLRPVALDAIIRAAIEVIRPAADEKRITLLTSAEPGPIVSGDPDRLQQVVLNLVSNAVKFTPPDGFVEVLLSQRRRNAYVVVRDTGKGIDPAFLPNVFERFYQADSSPARHNGGLGLGLAIVRHLVELHGGSVHAESEGLGKGAVFTVKLPLHIESFCERDTLVPAELDVDLALQNVRLDGVRVLVVDDEVDAREMVAALLSFAGAEVELVSSAAEALTKLSTFSADLMVSDVGMPGDDGYTLIQRVRASGAPYARIPALALTAYATPADARKALLAGFHAHVPKPIEPAVLTAVIARLLDEALPRS